MGEAMLENGRFEEAVIHLSNAAIAPGQPAELLQIFQQTIPSELFVQLVNAIPGAKARQMNSFQKQFGNEIIDAKIEEKEPIRDELHLE
jgi:hypothetical protein